MQLPVNIVTSLRFMADSILVDLSGPPKVRPGGGTTFHDNGPSAHSIALLAIIAKQDVGS